MSIEEKKTEFFRILLFTVNDMEYSIEDHSQIVEQLIHYESIEVDR